MSDVIEKTVILKAPLAKVWHAVSDARAFGTWFGVTFEGPFVAGQLVRGAIAKTEVDDAIAELQAPYVGMRCDLWIERIEPMRELSFRWHPGADADTTAGAPTTEVRFVLAEVPGGTRLTITESGFDAIPLERRAKVFAENDGGWSAQLTLVAKYVERSP